MDSLIVRRDASNTPAVFLLDSLDTVKGIINVWNGDPQAQPRQVDLSYYRTTKPVSDADEDTLVTQYRRVFNPAGGIVLRRRLYKVAPEAGGPHVQPQSVLHSPANLQAQQREALPEGASKPRMTIEQWDKAAFVDRVMNAFTVALSAALKEAMK